MKKAIIALSGGIDSAVAAAIAKKEGYNIICIFKFNLICNNFFCTIGINRKNRRWFRGIVKSTNIYISQFSFYLALPDNKVKTTLIT